MCKETVKPSEYSTIEHFIKPLSSAMKLYAVYYKQSKEQGIVVDSVENRSAQNNPLLKELI
jgi:hypothetical protein